MAEFGEQQEAKLYDIAIVTFDLPRLDDADAFTSFAPAGRQTYEYRIPKYLQGQVKPAQLGIVDRAGHTKASPQVLNPSVVQVLEVKNVLEGEWTGKYSTLIGVVDWNDYLVEVETERKRKRLLNLIKEEQKKLTNNMDFDRLAGLSPELASLVAELRKLG